MFFFSRKFFASFLFLHFYDFIRIYFNDRTTQFSSLHVHSSCIQIKFYFICVTVNSKNDISEQVFIEFKYSDILIPKKYRFYKMHRIESHRMTNY